jgi:hypothetical protein
VTWPGAKLGDRQPVDVFTAYCIEASTQVSARESSERRGEERRGNKN